MLKVGVKSIIILSRFESNEQNTQHFIMYIAVHGQKATISFMMPVAMEQLYSL
jgi:hypothetical protein